MTFSPLTNPVDYIELAGQRSPGIATVSGASSPRRWDERKGFAMSGARVVFRGIGLAHFTVTLRLVSAQDWDDWEAWRPLVQRPPVGVYARAQDIQHPILADLDITSAVVEDVSQPSQVEDGVWDIEIKFIEYRRPMPALSSIDGTDDQPRARSTRDGVIAGQSAQIEVLARRGSDGEAQAAYAQAVAASLGAQTLRGDS